MGNKLSGRFEQEFEEGLGNKLSGRFEEEFHEGLGNKLSGRFAIVPNGAQVAL